jgi:hypothetical protein
MLRHRLCYLLRYLDLGAQSLAISSAYPIVNRNCYELVMLHFLGWLSLFNLLCLNFSAFFHLPSLEIKQLSLLLDLPLPKHNKCITLHCSQLI